MKKRNRKNVSVRHSTKLERMRSTMLERKAKLDHSNMVERSPYELIHPRFNGEVYRPREDIEELAADIRKRGLLDPPIINRENVIISGNSRADACCRAGLKSIPCFVLNLKEGTPQFNEALVAANSHNREKTLAERAHERAVEGDPATAEEYFTDLKIADMNRVSQARKIDTLPKRKRAEILLNRDLANAAKNVIVHYTNEIGIKISLRQVHYRLLNNPPIRNIKTRDLYANTAQCYGTLSDVVTRLRLNGELEPDALLDEGRPITPLEYFSRDAKSYLDRFAETFGKDFRRNCTQSQMNFICVFVEKMTQRALIENHLLDKYPGIPLAVGRGYASISAIAELANAWKHSGKRKMILVCLSDCDPCGNEIKVSLGQTLEEMGFVQGIDFEIVNAGLTYEQAEREGARPSPIKANGKCGKTKAMKYIANGGKREVYELECLPPERLLAILDESLESVMDMKMVQAELEEMKRDYSELMALRVEMLRQCGSKRKRK